MTARLIATAAIIGAAILVAAVSDRLARAKGHDELSRYHFGRLARYGSILVAFVALLVVWRSFVGHLALFGGLFVAGLAFALQEVIGAIAGWFNIVSGGIYRIGDRVELGGVKGDVIDITPLRTKVLEMGSSRTEEPSWVGGRQYTGRVVSISNKATFDEPVYNYSTFFDFIWEELKLGVPYDTDWRVAEAILLEEAERVSDSEGARAAIEQMMKRYPVQKHEVDPRVYVTLTDNWVELAARFVIPVREARTVKDTMSRAIFDRFREAGIAVASSTVDVTVRGDVSSS